MKILVLVSHPIQYNSPLFSFIASQNSIDLTVYYTRFEASSPPFDQEFGIITNWNINLFEGYKYEFVNEGSNKNALLTFLGLRLSVIVDKIHKLNPAIILIYGWNHITHLHIMKHFSGKIPIVFRGDSTTIDDSNKADYVNFIKYKLLKWVYKHVDFVLSPGTASDLYFKKAGLADFQIIRARHAVNNAYFNCFSLYEENSLLDLRKRLLIKDDEVIFVFAGKFILKKNPLFLIEVFEAISKELKKIRLVLVGDGDLKNDILNKINRLDSSISRRINILPFQDQKQMKIIYRLADIFILPSSGPEETWGLSINEALASGIPVLVSSKCGCANDLVIEGINGYIFESNNKYDLISKMKKLNDFVYRKSLANQTKESIQQFSYNSFKKALDQIISTFEK
ncbi:MAG: glycosyltransferase family 4 protein [Chitinophagaceae bacterium]|jgi:glycosyltransferase involved in cell wall biosynthesis